MYEDFFAERLASLRCQMNVSAREMSLGIGQNCSYINRIENGKAFPSMQIFFYICEYLNITPAQFFEFDNKNTIAINDVVNELKKLDTKQLETILTVAKGLQHD